MKSVYVLYMYYVAYDWSTNSNFVFFFTLGLKSIPSFCFFCSLEAWNIQWVKIKLFLAALPNVHFYYLTEFANRPNLAHFTPKLFRWLHWPLAEKWSTANLILIDDISFLACHKLQTWCFWWKLNASAMEQHVPASQG